jgi:hypothetical protein
MSVMKKFTLLSLATAVVLGLSASPAVALPPYNMAFLKVYAGSPIEAPAKEAKCDVCHYGTDKVHRNDFGLALSKLGITRDAYAELRKDQKKLAAVLEEAFRKVEDEKSVSGVTFGELIKAGKLPGTTPEGAEDS